MTLDEAIKHCLEVAEQNETSAITYKNCKEIKANMYEKLTAEKAENDCRECVADHRQLAEWLTELKELREIFAKVDTGAIKPKDYLDLLDEWAKARKLLKEAVDDFQFLSEQCCVKDCACCPLDKEDFCEWQHEAEALALIGEDTNVPASADDTNVGGKIDSWISCKDRMPEVNEPVLFIFNTESGFKAVMYGWHETIKGLGSGWHQAGVGGARADEEVTYWQPLPEPPKDGDTE